jgi:putative transposase
MKKKAFTPEQIIGKLREAEVLLSQGHKVGEVGWKLVITKQTTTVGEGSREGCR